MIIYGKILNKAIELSDKELLEKMWFKEKNGQVLYTENHNFYNCGGMDRFDLLKDSIDDMEPSLGLVREAFDKRWRQRPFIDTYPSSSAVLHFEVPNWEHRDEIEFYTNYKDMLLIDERALYIMVIEVMKQAGGRISEDDKKTWISLEEFIRRHQYTISMTFDEANEISLEQAKTLRVIEERAPDSMTEKEYRYRGWKWDGEWFEEIYPDLKEKRIRKEKQEG